MWILLKRILVVYKHSKEPSMSTPKLLSCWVRVYVHDEYVRVLVWMRETVYAYLRILQVHAHRCMVSELQHQLSSTAERVQTKLNSCVPSVGVCSCVCVCVCERESGWCVGVIFCMNISCTGVHFCKRSCVDRGCLRMRSCVYVCGWHVCFEYMSSLLSLPLLCPLVLLLFSCRMFHFTS